MQNDLDYDGKMDMIVTTKSVENADQLTLNFYYHENIPLPLAAARSHGKASATKTEMSRLLGKCQMLT